MQSKLGFTSFTGMHLIKIYRSRIIVVGLALTSLLPLIFTSQINIASAHRKSLGATPTYTRSYYVQTVNQQYCENIGTLVAREYEQNGPADGVIIFAFGQPTVQNGTYGTYKYFDSSFISNLQIKDCVQAFAQGVWYGVPTLNPHLTLAVGTTNYGSGTTYNHGRAWAQMVSEIDSHIRSRGWLGQIAVVGASDIEIGWNDFATSNQWISGYSSVSGSLYYDFGDAQGCYPAQPGYSNGLMCDRGWTTQQVVWKAWGARPAYPMPQIYFQAPVARGGGNGGQWQKLSLYSRLNGYWVMNFKGSTTQWTSCDQLRREGHPDARCWSSGTINVGVFTNTWSEGWTHLQSKLYNNDPGYHGDDPNQNWCTQPSPPPAFQCHRTDDAVTWSTDVSRAYRCPAPCAPTPVPTRVP